jgi:uncharacterized membrane protein
MSYLSAEPIFDSYLAVALIAIGLVLLLFVGPRFGRLNIQRKLTLTALRIVVILLVTLALLRPTFITTVRTPRSSVLVMLLDLSRSMELPSGEGKLTRWQAQQAALKRAESSLANLGEQMEVRVYGYDEKLHPIDVRGNRLQLPEKPTGQQTDIGTSLAEALRPEQGKRLAAVIMTGDGAQTAFEPRIEVPEAGRKVRDDFAAPLYTVTFGPASDATQARDVAIDRLDEEYTVFVKNEVVITGLVRVRGYVKQDIPVELTIEDDQGNKQVIGQQTIRADEDDRQLEVVFPYTPQKPGHYRLTLSAPQQPGELVAKNNSLNAYLTVLEGGLRVLYLDGSARFEQKFIRRALNASPDIELDDRIVDRRSRAHWPIDLGDDLKAGKYDAFILGDIQREALGDENIRMIADLVSKGRGLIMIGGRNSFGWGGFRGTPLEDLLPIQIDRIEGTDDLSEASRDRFFLDGPLQVQPGDDHPVTRLAPKEQNVQAWRNLPPLNWANKFAGVSEAPGVRVLLTTSRDEPILISGEYGRGRVLAFAGESTFLWQMNGFEREHKRFWRQVILWLVRRDELERDDVWVKLEQRRFYPGAKVNIAAGARTSAGDPISSAVLDTVLVGPNGSRTPIRLSADKEQFVGSVTVTEPGDYAIETTASDGGKQLGTARAEFLVFDRDVELSNPSADPDQMASLAAWTKEEGGRAVAPEELPQLIAEIAARPQEYDERQTKWRLGSTAGDAWLFFVLICGVLTGEWWLRKKWGLV